MLKKKNTLEKQLIIKQSYLSDSLETIIVDSLRTNVSLKPHVRLSFLVKKNSAFNRFNFFKTYQKLHCLVSLSPKVHNRAYHYSRFFLNKQLPFLTVSNTLK